MSLPIIDRLARTSEAIGLRCLPDPACNGRSFDRTRNVGAHFLMGRDAMTSAIMEGEPCRIMARDSGRGMLALAARGAGTSGRKSR